MDFYGLSSIAPGWITVRNTVGQAWVGMQANKAGLVKVLDVKWQLSGRAVGKLLLKGLDE